MVARVAFLVGYQATSVFQEESCQWQKTYHLKMYFLLDFRLEKVDFHCQVNLLEGKYGTTVDGSEIQKKHPTCMKACR